MHCSEQRSKFLAFTVPNNKGQGQFFALGGAAMTSRERTENIFHSKLSDVERGAAGCLKDLA